MPVRDLPAEGLTMLVLTYEMTVACDVLWTADFLKGKIREKVPPAKVFANLRTEKFRAFPAQGN